MVGISAATVAINERPKNRPELGLFVYLMVAAAVIGGFLFGYDTSVVSAAMLYAPKSRDLAPITALWQELIVSITPGMAIFGALFSGILSNRMGRKKIIIYSSIVFAFGAVICAAAFNKIILLFGRILLGTALGFASMIVPIYIGEATPYYLRGSLVTCFSLVVTAGQVFANIFGGIFSYIDPENIGWRLMFGAAAIPAVVQIICFVFLPESPRWLYEHGRHDEARQVLSKIYKNDQEWVEFEMRELSMACDGIARDGLAVLGRVLTTSHVRKALIVGSGLQMFQQLAGINTVMYYTGNIIRSAGVRDPQTTIWISVGTSSLNTIGSLIPLFLVEKMGRRMMFLSSQLGVTLTLAAMGISFLLINKDSATAFPATQYQSPMYNSSDYNAIHCQQMRNCDFCVTDDRCGFCEEKATGQGYCLPFPSGTTTGLADTGICSSTRFMNGSSYEWEDNYCYTKYTALPIIIMVFYLLSFGLGFGSMPWVLNSEFYPQWARSTCVSIATATNWLSNLIVSLTFLTLTQAATKYGTFFIYCGLCIVSAIWVYFLVPETKGYSIDDVEQLFMSPKEKEAVLERQKVADK